MYHVPESCNKCGTGTNKVEVTATDGGHMSECKTVCELCGFTDYWAHGYFESAQEITSCCKTYSFTKKPLPKPIPLPKEPLRDSLWLNTWTTPPTPRWDGSYANIRGD